MSKNDLEKSNFCKEQLQKNKETVAHITQTKKREPVTISNGTKLFSLKERDTDEERKEYTVLDDQSISQQIDEFKKGKKEDINLNDKEKEKTAEKEGHEEGKGISENQINEGNKSAYAIFSQGSHSISNSYVYNVKCVEENKMKSDKVKQNANSNEHNSEIPSRKREDKQYECYKEENTNFFWNPELCDKLLQNKFMLDPYKISKMCEENMFLYNKNIFKIMDSKNESLLKLYDNELNKEEDLFQLSNFDINIKARSKEKSNFSFTSTVDSVRNDFENVGNGNTTIINGFCFSEQEKVFENVSKQSLMYIVAIQEMFIKKTKKILCEKCNDYVNIRECINNIFKDLLKLKIEKQTNELYMTHFLHKLKSDFLNSKQVLLQKLHEKDIIVKNLNANQKILNETIKKYEDIMYNMKNEEESKFFQFQIHIHMLFFNFKEFILQLLLNINRLFCEKKEKLSLLIGRLKIVQENKIKGEITKERDKNGEILQGRSVPGFFKNCIFEQLQKKDFKKNSLYNAMKDTKREKKKREEIYGNYSDKILCMSNECCNSGLTHINKKNIINAKNIKKCKKRKPKIKLKNMKHISDKKKKANTRNMLSAYISDTDSERNTDSEVTVNMSMDMNISIGSNKSSKLVTDDSNNGIGDNEKNKLRDKEIDIEEKKKIIMKLKKVNKKLKEKLRKYKQNYSEELQKNKTLQFLFTNKEEEAERVRIALKEAIDEKDRCYGHQKKKYTKEIEELKNSLEEAKCDNSYLMSRNKEYQQLIYDLTRKVDRQFLKEQELSNRIHEVNNLYEKEKEKNIYMLSENVHFKGFPFPCENINSCNIPMQLQMSTKYLRNSEMTGDSSDIHCFEESKEHQYGHGYIYGPNPNPNPNSNPNPNPNSNHNQRQGQKYKQGQAHRKTLSQEAYIYHNPEKKQYIKMSPNFEKSKRNRLGDYNHYNFPLYSSYEEKYSENDYNNFFYNGEQFENYRNQKFYETYFNRIRCEKEGKKKMELTGSEQLNDKVFKNKYKKYYINEKERVEEWKSNSSYEDGTQQDNNIYSVQKNVSIGKEINLGKKSKSVSGRVEKETEKKKKENNENKEKKESLSSQVKNDILNFDENKYKKILSNYTKEEKEIAKIKEEELYSIFMQNWRQSNMDSTDYYNNEDSLNLSNSFFNILNNKGICTNNDFDDLEDIDNTKDISKNNKLMEKAVKYENEEKQMIFGFNKNTKMCDSNVTPFSTVEKKNVNEFKTNASNKDPISRNTFNDFDSFAINTAKSVQNSMQNEQEDMLEKREEFVNTSEVKKNDGNNILLNDTHYLTEKFEDVLNNESVNDTNSKNNINRGNELFSFCKQMEIDNEEKDLQITYKIYKKNNEKYMRKNLIKKDADGNETLKGNMDTKTILKNVLNIRSNNSDNESKIKKKNFLMDNEIDNFPNATNTKNHINNDIIGRYSDNSRNNNYNDYHKNNHNTNDPEKTNSDYKTDPCHNMSSVNSSVGEIYNSIRHGYENNTCDFIHFSQNDISPKVEHEQENIKSEDDNGKKIKKNNILNHKCNKTNKGKEICTMKKNDSNILSNESCEKKIINTIAPSINDSIPLNTCETENVLNSVLGTITKMGQENLYKKERQNPQLHAMDDFLCQNNIFQNSNNDMKEDTNISNMSLVCDQQNFTCDKMKIGINKFEKNKECENINENENKIALNNRIDFCGNHLTKLYNTTYKEFALNDYNEKLYNNQELRNTTNVINSINDLSILSQSDTNKNQHNHINTCYLKNSMYEQQHQRRPETQYFQAEEMFSVVQKRTPGDKGVLSRVLRKK